MTLLFPRLVSRVRVALDQNQGEMPLLANDEHTLEVYDIIRASLLRASRWVLERAPLELVDTHKDFGTVGASTDESGRLELALPSDWLRLWSMKISSWRVPVRACFPADSEASLLAVSDFAGVRPCADRPMAVDDGVTLTLYGSPGTLEHAEYIAMPRVYDNNKIDLPERLVDAIVLFAAGLTSDALHDEQHGVALKQSAMGFMGVAPREEKPDKKEQ